MQRFHQSRGRIFFEVLCALAIAVSLVVAWQQTGASALLAAAAAALLYAVVHAFDMTGRRPNVAEPPAVEGSINVAETTAVDDEPTALAAEPPLKPSAAPEPEPRQAKAPRKASPKRQRKQPKAVKPELAMAEADAPLVVAVPAPDPAELTLSEEPEALVMLDPEVPHSPVAPLFEPEPFVRMQRQAFGRRGRL